MAAVMDDDLTVQVEALKAGCFRLARWPPANPVAGAALELLFFANRTTVLLLDRFTCPPPGEGEEDSLIFRCLSSNSFLFPRSYSPYLK